MTTPSSQNREIRVFVSSTFQDMKAERDRLVKYVFPELRELCQERGVTFTEVDLRWGITKEQEVLRICLGEIDRCRPFFICMLGERYGSVLGQIERQLMDEEPWLREHQDRSVTELEVVHGVLNNHAMANRAYFFFRDPAYIDSLPPNDRPEYLEAPTQDDIKEHGRESAEQIASEHRSRLEALKTRIREESHKNRVTLREGYPDPKTFGEWVEHEFRKLIDQEYPLHDQRSRLEQEADEHEMSARSLTAAYVERREYPECLTEHVQGEGAPLVVFGEAGSGKSALLANWFRNYQETHKHDFTLIHFIGATTYSSDWVSMLRRIMGELKHQCSIEQRIPDSTDELRVAFVHYLHAAATRKRVVLILDALNQLEDRDAAPDLGWLPKDMPNKIRLIVSTTPQSRPFEELRRRNWPTLEVGPLRPEEREELVTEYLARFAKTLDSNQLKRIADAHQAKNPLFVRVLLDELRLFGDYTKLSGRIDHYLAASTVTELYKLVLSRYEADYQHDRKDLVPDVMKLIWAARRGISEFELRAMLEPKDEPMPANYWAPLRRASEHSFVNHSGLISFSHEYFRKAVEEKYLSRGREQRKSHLKVADYFKEQKVSERTAEELPWQLLQAGETKQLRDCLGNLDIFGKLNSEASQYELLRYWRFLEGYDPYEVYTESLDHLEAHSNSDSAVASSINAVANFLGLALHFDAAEQLYRRSLDLNIRALGPCHPDTSSSLNNLGLALKDKGDYDGAKEYLQRAVELDERTSPFTLETANSIDHLATVCGLRGEFGRAEELQRRSLAIRESVVGREHPDVASSLDGLSVLLFNRHKWAEAESFCRRALHIRESNPGPNHPLTAHSRCVLASLRRAQGDLNGAELLFRQAIPVFESNFGPFHTQTNGALNNFALLLDEQGNTEEAEQLLTRVLEANQKVFGATHPETAMASANLAAILEDKGDLVRAHQLYEDALEILESSLGASHPAVYVVRDNFDRFLKRQGNLKGINRIIRQTVAKAEKDYGRGHPELSTVIHHLVEQIESQMDGEIDAGMIPYTVARHLAEHGDRQRARQYAEQALLQQEETIGQEHPATMETMSFLGSLLRTDDADRALELLDRVLDLRERVAAPQDKDMATDLYSLAVLLQSREDYDTSEVYYRKALALFNKLYGPYDQRTIAARNGLDGLLY